MNVQITFSKIKQKEKESFLKIRKIINSYINFLLLDYLQNNMTDEDLKEFEKFVGMFENNEELNDLKNKFESDTQENINMNDNNINNILKEINEENEYFLGKKSIPISKELEIDMV